MCCTAITAFVISSHAATITGKVTDSSGTSLGGIQVLLRTAAMQPVVIGGDTTDASGAFSIPCDSTSGKFVLRSFAISSSYINKYDTVVVDGTDKSVTVVMTGAYSVSGSVTDSATGSALAGAIVSVTISGSFIPLLDTTGTDGKYLVNKVKTGAITVSISMKEYAIKSVTDTVKGASKTIDVSLSKQQYGTISGTVKDSSSTTPIAGAIVGYYTFVQGQYKLKSDTCDDNGKYSLDSVPYGKIVLNGSKSEYSAKNSDTLTIATAQATVYDFLLSKITHITVSGKVTDSVSGVAIAGASVVIYQQFTKVDSVTTTADGLYSSAKAVAGGTTIAISAPGYGSFGFGKFVQITSTVDTTVNVTLTAAAGITKNHRVDIDHRATISVSGGKLMICNITGSTTVRIFSVNGRMLRQQSTRSSGDISFDIGSLAYFQTLIVQLTGLNGELYSQKIIF
jgi:uncharacterized glyoxalase superfamily protein PhnB